MVTHVLGITWRRLFKKKKYVACCITALMYPICGATLNFRLDPFLSFVLDDTVPEFFLFADTMAAKRQLQTLALGWVPTWGARVSSAGPVLPRGPRPYKGVG